ncbi:MAG: putative sulfate exporter family transporter [Wenzhouxiangellaceae bacterium]
MNLSLSAVVSKGRQRFPGLLVALIIAMASGFVADHYGGPTLLYALLFGMELNHLATVERYREGINWTSKSVLRLGVALLGARITLDQILALGPQPLLIVLLGVPFTIISGLLLARALGLSREFGALSGVAVAICGASAAMAMASVLPQRKDGEAQLIFTVIGVTSLSTVAMIVYPLISELLGLTPLRAGIFLGSTIHDVAQVVGAGYLLGDEAGHTATFTKLMRVAMLVPVIVIMSLWFKNRDAESASTDGVKPPLLPGFLLAFVALVAINSMGWISAPVGAGMTELSRWCLVAAIAAVGVKASLKELATLGWRPLLMMIGETVLLALLVTGLLLFNNPTSS